MKNLKHISKLLIEGGSRLRENDKSMGGGGDSGLRRNRTKQESPQAYLKITSDSSESWNLLVPFSKFVIPARAGTSQSLNKDIGLDHYPNMVKYSELHLNQTQ